MGLALILIGLVLWLFISAFLGAICILVGIILVFVPGAPYGYSRWRGRGRPP